MEHPKHSAPPEARRETATNEARETGASALNRAERRRLASIDRQVKSLDRQIEREERKLKP